MQQIEATRDCRIIVAATTDKLEGDLTDMPSSARVIYKGPEFIDDLQTCLSEWELSA